MALFRTTFSSTPEPEFGAMFAQPPHRFPLPEGRKSVQNVGAAATGFNANWTLRSHRSRLSIDRREFLCIDGEYMLVEAPGGWQGSNGGEIYLCRDGALEPVGTADRGFHSIGDIVTGHHDPEALRLRLLKRRDNTGSVEAHHVALTPRKGPLRDLPVGGRFVTSWGQHAEVVDQGSRSTRFKFCPADPELPVITLSSTETQMVCSRTGRSRAQGQIRAHVRPFVGFIAPEKMDVSNRRLT